MAIECLVRAVTNPAHSGLARRHFWAQGEIVTIKQSPAVWGREEDPDKVGRNPKTFWIITVEGVDIGDPIVQTLLEPGVEDVDETRLSRRLRWLDVSLLPNRLRTQLRNTKRITIQARDIADFNAAQRVRTTERTDDGEVEP